MAQALEPGYDLIITNGDAAGEILRKVIRGAEVMPWRDVLHEGPVPLTDTHEELSVVRARFLADRGWGDREGAREAFRARDRGLAHHGVFERVVLWFEHDLYDQLQLIQILDWFAGAGRAGDTLLLVQSSDFLIAQEPETLASMRQLETPVDEAQFALARRAWDAFRQPTPEHWAGLLADDLTALPYLKPAVQRMLEELPSARTGLSRTEHEILLAIDNGTDNPRHLFLAVQGQEEAAFMGDWSFWTCLDGLGAPDAPLVAGFEGAFDPAGSPDALKAYFNSTLRLTELGEAVLSAAADRAEHLPVDRWFGGTHLTGGNLWRWDRDEERLVEPSR